MGTHLSTPARHLAVALTLAVGAAGAVALPAWAASHGKSPAQHRTGQHAPVGSSVGTGAAVSDAAVSTTVGTGAPVPGSATSTKVGSGTAVLGPAVKYVRHKDGSIHRVR
jgi:hypothetical protein